MENYKMIDENYIDSEIIHYKEMKTIYSEEKDEIGHRRVRAKIYILQKIKEQLKPLPTESLNKESL